jgi:hypothetical protein
VSPGRTAGQAASDIAVHGGSEDASVEGAAPDRASGTGGEHELGIRGGEMLAQQVDQERR